MARLPEHRKEDVIFLDVPDPRQPYGYNPLKRVAAGKRPLATSGLLEVFEKMWPEAWGVRMDHIFRNALLALLDSRKRCSLTFSGSSLIRHSAMRSSETSKTHRCVNSGNMSTKSTQIDALRRDRADPEQDGRVPRKPHALPDPHGPERPINIRRIMDEGKIHLVNFAKGQIGEDASSLLGGLLVTTIGLAAFSRQEIDVTSRRPFYCYLDEFRILRRFRWPICSPSSEDTGSA